MILDARVVVLNEALEAVQNLAAHYADVMQDSGDALMSKRLAQFEQTENTLAAQVSELGELPKGADRDKATLEQLLDNSSAALAEFTGGAAGKAHSETLATREQQLQSLFRELLTRKLEQPLSCEASDVLEAAVVESERAEKQLLS